MYYLYILLNSVTKKFYIGQTKNLERRLYYHNSGFNKSTKGKGSWELAYKEIFPFRTDAIKREKELKAKKSKQFIISLIKNGERPE
ncbi:MAG TPA: GIY-YIG nuclease family protein [Ignavibacteriaceae bacterium]|jgi:putative endonuclease